ncbi:MAG: hypothetical protein KBT29_00995 [Prevotellaceae bacterium]|nr:hypothetical protein [Candidatus Minthosoma caballi]
MINIKEKIEDTSKLTPNDVAELRDLVDRYPFFQAARLLYLAGLFQQHSTEFGKELKKASVFVPDRIALFSITEGINYEIPKETQTSPLSIETESDDNRTIKLIDNFLSGRKASETSDTTERSQPTLADLTTDYASFLMQESDEDTSKIAEPTEPAEAQMHANKKKPTPKLRGEDLINLFIEETKGKQRFEMPDLPSEDFISPEISVEDEEIYTESMVNIYIKQGRYAQALEILRKICLNNPKKNANFAAQIELLEIILSKN